MKNDSSQNLLINILWSFFGRFGYLTVGLITNIILARLLSPKEFGKIGIIMFFIIISTVLIESGLSGALVRKKNATKDDYSTIFIFNLITSLILILILITTADHIAKFYNDTELKNILTFSSFILLINALRITQSTKLIKYMQFKKKAIYELFAIIIGSIISIYMAFNEAGIWSLVFLQLSTSITLTIILWLFVGPVTSYKFSIHSFKQFYKFGINTTLASVLNTTFDNIYQLILGKYFSISQTGYFYQAKKIQEIPTSILQSTILGVMYSALSKLQEDTIKFNALYLNTIRFFTIIVSVICMIIFFYSDLIINILYGEKWISSAEYLQLLIISSFFYLQELFNRIIFKIFDRTEKILQLEIIKKAIQLCTIIYGVLTMSIENLLYGFILTSILSFLINYYYARKIQKTSSWKDFFIIIKTLSISIITILICSFITLNYELKGIEKLWIFPLMLLINISLLHISKIINIKNDFKSFSNLLNRDIKKTKTTHKKI